MAAIAGIFYFDRRRVPREVIQALTRANSAHAPDGSVAVCDDGVAVLHFASHFDSLSRLERQPCATPGGLIVSLDGRIDNRSDLCLALQNSLAGNQQTDIALTAAALERYGSDALPRLVGDWSLAVWDSSRRQLLLARDYMGNRTLYYHCDSAALVWSTCLEALVELLHCGDDLNETYIAAVLTDSGCPEIAPFGNIRALPAACSLRIGERGIPTISRYWTFASSEIRYRQTWQYDEHLRHVFEEAVAVRLRASGPVVAELSGGYDSSAIVCMANSLVRQRKVESPRVQPFSRVFNASAESDEREYIKSVEDWTGLKSALFSERALDVRTVNRGVRPLNADSDRVAVDYVSSIAGHMILSGEGGDMVMGKSKTCHSGLLEHLYAWQFREFLVDTMTWTLSQDLTLRSGLYRLLKEYTPQKRVLAQERHKAIHLAARAHRLRTNDVATAFGLDPSFVARTRPALGVTSYEYDYVPRPKRRIVAALSFYRNREIFTSRDGPYAVAKSFPYVHRPLVEFVLSIPQMALWNPAMKRGFMRRAFDGFMPAHVLDRENKGYAVPAVSRSLRPLAVHLLSTGNLEVVERGYVDKQATLCKLRQIVDGALNASRFMHNLMWLEIWLRRRYRDSVGSTSDAEMPLRGARSLVG